MPHKHKRKRGNDEAEFNLPPSQRARPLPVVSKNANKDDAKKTTKVTSKNPPKKGAKDLPDNKDAAPKVKKGKKGRQEHDAPRAFRRLMSVAQGRKVRSGLDNGDGGKAAAKEASEKLKIRPGEDMRAFAQRVDASLPVAGLTKKTAIKDGKDEVGLKVFRTRKERNMHKLYEQWRVEEQKIQDKREEEADEAIGRELDEDPSGTTALAQAQLNEATAKSTRRKRGKVDDDPWAELKKKRAEAKISLHEQAQAPPELNKNTSRQLKIASGDATADVGNIPKSAGSLKRREELQEVRADVMDAYRKIREHEQAKLLAKPLQFSIAPAIPTSSASTTPSNERKKKFFKASLRLKYETYVNVDDMASELEGLIAGLLVHISCAGEQGKFDCFAIIHESDPEGQKHRTASTIWSWLVARRDISVGPDRRYNHLTLDEILALSPPTVATGQDEEPPGSSHSSQAAPHHILVYASEETMWESLTGHAVDYKRVPKSEWLLLLGIASTTTQGILQGDLGRLVDQDKRSVPKRTDALLKKGYIAKRTTLVRGTKTSKMWLKLFAPPLPKDGEGTDELRPDMTFTRQALVDNLDPVPWHIRWTGESIDYTALATSIMAISKEWGVLRMTDMKSKLGVLGMRWQMKVLAKVCRFLNSRGVIQYVAAKLEDKVFKDCIKYVRDFTPEDWSLYLATGKRQSKPPRNPDMDGLEGNKQLLGQASNVSEVSTAPPWSLDKPVPVIIAEMAQRLGDVGLTNPDVYALTLGPSYSRHLSSMTTALSVTNLQPPHLSHFQLRSEHTRAGKVASYRYFAANGSPSGSDEDHASNETGNTANGQSTSTTDLYGFSLFHSETLCNEASVSLIELCNLGMANRKPKKGRPKKLNIKKQKAAPAAKANPARKQLTPKDSPAPRQETITEENGTPQDEAVIAQNTAVQDPDVHLQDTTGPQEAVQHDGKISKPDDAPSTPHETDKLLVTLKVSGDALNRLPVTISTDVSTPARATRTRSVRSSAKKADVEITSATADVEDIEVENEAKQEAQPEIPNKNPLGSRKRGRPKKGEMRQKGNGPQNADGDSGSRPWVCEKCNGSWKNDIGLKYHLEKSRTPCNPSFDESAALPARRGRKRAVSEIEDPDASTAAPGASPRAKAADQKDSEAEERQQDSEYESLPTPAKRVSKLRGPVAARPTWSSRPTVSFKQDSFQVNPEWRRPPVASFDTPKKPTLPNGANGALVQTDDGQPRPVLGPLDRFNAFANSPKTPRSRSQRKDSQQVTETPQQEQSEPGREATNGLLNGSAVKSMSPAVVDSPVPKGKLIIRLCEIIQEILAEQSGAFPGGEALWRAMSIRWGEQFPAHAIPQVRTYQAAVRDLIKNKKAAEHFHTFRSSKGVTEKCHVVIQAGVDPFSPEATSMVERIKEAHPDVFIPPPFDAQIDPDLLKRGRRNLPEEVEMLNAPVYVARAAQKRALEEFDDYADDLPPPPKRARRRKKATRGNSLSPTRDGKTEDITWVSNSQEDENAEQGWYDHLDSFANSGAPEAIQFLEPNTFLEEDPPEWLSRRHSRDSPGIDIDPALDSRYLPGEMVFDKAILVSGDNGVWPYLSVQDFETQDASYTLRGWMPDMNWFAWSSMIDVVDQRALVLRRRKRQSRTDHGRYERFVERLHCCMDTERAWKDSFYHAPTGAAGPHNIFVTFFSGADMEMLDVPALSWPQDWQLTPKSFPSFVPDRRLLVDSSSSDEDNDAEWPRLPMPEPKPKPKPSKASVERVQTTASRRQQSQQPQQPQQPRVKRVRLVTRALMSISAETGQSGNCKTAKDVTEEADRLLAAFIAVRVLLGGSDKAIDWGLLLKLFPAVGLDEMRRFWINARRDQGPYIGKLTKDFQDKFLIAYQRDELPGFDFNDYDNYEWHELIDWTLELPRRKGVELPSTRRVLEDDFLSHKAPHVDNDWREKFYHVQSSVFSRFEATTCHPATITIDKMLSGLGEQVELSDKVIARSWIRSLCCTDDSRYSVDQIRQKFWSLAKGDQDRNNTLLKQAIDDLSKQRVICRSKKAPLGGRPYRLNEWYSHMMDKLAQRKKYKEAADFKVKLDTAFRRGDAFRVPFNLDDGSVMALTNLNASERIKLVPVDVPDIPLGFEPGNYESRKFPKSYYHFGMDAVPTASYKYDEDIDVLRKTIYEGPPTAGKEKESVLPQWVDFFGRRNAETWMDVLGACCFVFATRGYLTVEGVCSALKPILEEFEAQMVIDWGKKTGVLRESEDGLGVTAGEWWWLAVPWQWGRQLRRRGDD
ncbi:hypothetical protein FZEAL_8075 [Fusarium zealandicum]|uniref:Uncharacterized protein n=1 Tax=Fusarium zealandicum TaxID=1053134 RepID=A0A8H4UF44_9HYPO|nr:hypothetical protein FZEAL_8075 [Fusarium zealandicum]